MKHETGEVRIPITMCHGTSWQPDKVKHQENLLTAERFERYCGIVLAACG